MGLVSLTIIEGRDFDFFYAGNYKKGTLRLIRGTDHEKKQKSIFVKVSILKESRNFEKTPTSSEEFPKWNTSFEFSVEKPQKHPLFFQIVGREGTDKGNDTTLGTASIKLWALPANQEQDIWIKLKNAPGGSIHIRFKFQPDENNFTSQIFSVHRDVKTLPLGWEVYTHETTGKKVFVHHSTKTFSDYDPRGEIGKTVTGTDFQEVMKKEGIPLFGNWRNTDFSRSLTPPPEGREEIEEREETKPKEVNPNNEPSQKVNDSEKLQPTLKVNPALRKLSIDRPIILPDPERVMEKIPLPDLVPIPEERKKDLDKEWNELLTKVVN